MQKIRNFIILNNQVVLCFIILLNLFIMSCNESKVYSKEYEFDSEIWKEHEIKEFDFEINDLSNVYDIYLIFDLVKDFSTNNLWLDIKSTSPSGNSERDTVMFFVCDKTGKWLGETKGDVISNKFLFKKNIKFPEKGVYKIEYEHLMRDNNLPKIKSLGILIEYSDTNSDQK
jgi:gliding motility-associated lipoprotein GldH